MDVLAEILPAIIRGFPWPKSMRWGAASVRAGSLRWVRPLHSIVATFGPETEEPEIVAFDVDGIAAGNVTYGHRFLAPGAVHGRRFDDYVAGAREAPRSCSTPSGARTSSCTTRATSLSRRGWNWSRTRALLEEVAGLVEWPVVLMGEFDEAFLESRRR